MLKIVTDFEIFLDYCNTVSAEHRSPEPQQETGTGYYGNEDKPEPKECENLLVKEVYRKHALDSVILK
jgi:hypothetical protein